MTFCTVISCMDGRIQLPVNDYLRQRFNTEYVDTITEAGPNLILCDQEDRHAVQSIFDRLQMSIGNHKSVGVAIVGHHDCVGNPANREAQIIHLQKAINYIRSEQPRVEIIGLWVNDNWEVEEIAPR